MELSARLMRKVIEASKDEYNILFDCNTWIIKNGEEGYDG